VKSESLSRKTTTTLYVESTTWSAGAGPSVSTILGFAQTLQKYVDAGFLEPGERIRMRDTTMAIAVTRTEEEKDIDLATERALIAAQQRAQQVAEAHAILKPKKPTEATKVFAPAKYDPTLGKYWDTDVDG
jgi:DNA-binding transcriptional MocR family regulator